MASLFVVAIKERAVNAFLRPFYVPAQQAAIRSFADEINRTESEMNKHPEDYDLYNLGLFDEDKGTFSSTTGPELLVRGQDCTKGK